MLSLPPDVVADIRAHGEQSFPNECCGVLLGNTNEEQRTVAEVMAINNAFDESEKYHRFLITPEDYRLAEKRAREKKLEILGFYHTHPDSPSVASRYDLDHAFPWFSYLIVSIIRGRFHDFHSWIMEDDRSSFREETVVVE